MIDNFANAVTYLINSARGPLVAGGLVWVGFDRLNSVLKEDKKMAVAVWLLDKGKNAEALDDKTQNWPSTFASIFDTIFGERHVTWAMFPALVFGLGLRCCPDVPSVGSRSSR